MQAIILILLSFVFISIVYLVYAKNKSAIHAYVDRKAIKDQREQLLEFFYSGEIEKEDFASAYATLEKRETRLYVVGSAIVASVFVAMFIITSFIYVATEYVFSGEDRFYITDIHGQGVAYKIDRKTGKVWVVTPVGEILINLSESKPAEPSKPNKP